ncbi:MAG: 50S ribosomal protein L13 [Candidatus Diapherotrites archaeon]|nr:50S ribosomal protein L13 [Candidatus Micrarchaeota archaeon]MBU1939320.1 50S ribosomal protein L13 [Candidatus Micrarchaeota archaeon]
MAGKHKSEKNEKRKRMLRPKAEKYKVRDRAAAGKKADKRAAIMIDGANLVLGRLASEVAKKLLNGEKVTIFNAEKIVVIGRRENIIRKFNTRLTLAQKGNPENGPKFSRMPDRMVRHAVRGMLPFKRKRGREAFANLSVVLGTPEGATAGAGIVKGAENSSDRYMKIEDISKVLGAKW